jgi:hypothetical protein
MPTKNHILFLVPDGVGIKNYLYSNIISHLKATTKITIWSPLPKDAFDNVKELHNINFDYKTISFQPESIKTRLYREATTYARLRHNARIQNNDTILTNWRRPKYSFKVKMLYRLAEMLGKFLSKNYQNILKFEKKSRQSIPEKLIEKYTLELKALQPSSIFITHQRVAGLMPICKAAKNLGIKTTTAIFSWDNVPKARLSVKTDNYLVWSNLMKEEMKIYYPEISDDNIELVGTPQFEFYLDKNRVSTRQQFANTHGLDISKIWLCFSGDDFITSPHDELFLKDVLESLHPMKDAIQIIFRRCPVDFSDRYDATLNNYKGLVIAIDPKWNAESTTGWVGYFPMYEDINLQVNLVAHCNLVINLGSTMAHDFTTHNKPCLYLNYNPSKEFDWSTDIIYNFQHFRSMKGLDAVGWINSKEEILDVVSKTLEQPDSIASDKLEWMKKVVRHPLDQSAIKIAKAIL